MTDSFIQHTISSHPSITTELGGYLYDKIGEKYIGLQIKPINNALQIPEIHKEYNASNIACRADIELHRIPYKPISLAIT